jgi:dTDP-4-dehydrorhamnose reductase
VLYGPVQYLGESAVTALLEKLKEPNPCSISDYEVRRPAHVDEVAKVIRDLAVKKVQASLYHHYLCHKKVFYFNYKESKFICTTKNYNYKHIYFNYGSKFVVMKYLAATSLMQMMLT